MEIRDVNEQIFQGGRNLNDVQKQVSKKRKIAFFLHFFWRISTGNGRFFHDFDINRKNGAWRFFVQVKRLELEKDELQHALDEAEAALEAEETKVPLAHPLPCP